MKLGVVIVTYNRLNLLKECIEACINQEYKFDKILIINNNSNDGTKQYLDSLHICNLNVINLQENIGGAGGFYTGVKELSKLDLDYILLIDDDAILDKDYNSKIVKHMIKNNDNICAYSGTVETNNNIQYEHRRHLKKGFKCIDSKKEEYEKEYFDYELSTFCGLYISTKIIKKIGFPNKDFFIWFDDTEYSLRLKKYGKIRNLNTTKLNHKTTISRDGGYSWKSYYSLRNQIIIVKEYFSRITLIKFISDMYIKIIAGKVIRILKNDVYYNEVSNMYINALKDGLRNNLGKNNKYINGFELRKKSI